MLRGHVAVFLSCSEKFKQAVAWPVRDALAEHNVHGIIVNDEPPLPGTGEDPEAKVETYLDASSAFVALCTADHGISDGTRFPQANIIDEIQRAMNRPHLRDRSQILRSPGVLLPSSIDPTCDLLDPGRPSGAAEVILKQLEAWGLVPARPGPPSSHGVTDAGAADDLRALFAGLQPGDHEEARRRIYRLLRDRRVSRRRWIARTLLGEVMEADDDSRQCTAATLLEAMSGLDASLVPIEMIETLAAHSGYLPRSCAAHILRHRAILTPFDIPVGILGRLALPSGEDWYVWVAAMDAVKELVLSRRDAYVIFDALSVSAEPQDRQAVAQALLDVAAVRPAAVARDLAERLLDDPDPLVARKAREVMTAIEHVTDREREGRHGHFRALTYGCGPSPRPADRERPPSAP
jgi:hypothetical protein